MIETTLHTLIEGQTVYNNVIFEDENKRTLNYTLSNELINLTFHNCVFNMLNMSCTKVENCLFDHCTFNYIYVSNKSTTFVNTTFNNCIFNYGRIHKNETMLKDANLFVNCVNNNLGIFYHYDKDYDPKQDEELQWVKTN